MFVVRVLCFCFCAARCENSHTPTNTTKTKTTAPSAHWGCEGELWDPAGRLPPDWSFAGYAAGEAPIPDVPQVANVKTDFGAKGDNVTDDTLAFEKALNATAVDNGALFIPAGVYRITRVLNTRKAVVLRGAGRDATTLYLPYSLTDVYGNTYSKEGTPGTSDYSHGTGFINWWGYDPIARDRTWLATVVEPAARGDTVLKVSTTAGMAVGQWVRLAMNNTAAGELVVDMNGFLMPSPPNAAGRPQLLRHMSRIVQMGTGWIRCGCLVVCFFGGGGPVFSSLCCFLAKTQTPKNQTQQKKQKKGWSARSSPTSRSATRRRSTAFCR